MKQDSREKPRVVPVLDIGVDATVSDEQIAQVICCEFELDRDRVHFCEEYDSGEHRHTMPSVLILRNPEDRTASPGAVLQLEMFVSITGMGQSQLLDRYWSLRAQLAYASDRYWGGAWMALKERISGDQICGTLTDLLGLSHEAISMCETEADLFDEFERSESAISLGIVCEYIPPDYPMALEFYLPYYSNSTFPPFGDTMSKLGAELGVELLIHTDSADPYTMWRIESGKRPRWVSLDVDYHDETGAYRLEQASDGSGFS